MRYPLNLPPLQGLYNSPPFAIGVPRFQPPEQIQLRSGFLTFSEFLICQAEPVVRGRQLRIQADRLRQVINALLLLALCLRNNAELHVGLGQTWVQRQSFIQVLLGWLEPGLSLCCCPPIPDRSVMQTGPRVIRVMCQVILESLGNLWLIGRCRLVGLAQ